VGGNVRRTSLTEKHPNPSPSAPPALYQFAPSENTIHAGTHPWQPSSSVPPGNARVNDSNLLSIPRRIRPSSASGGASVTGHRHLRAASPSSEPPDASGRPTPHVRARRSHSNTDCPVAWSAHAAVQASRAERQDGSEGIPAEGADDSGWHKEIVRLTCQVLELQRQLQEAQRQCQEAQVRAAPMYHCWLTTVSAELQAWHAGKAGRTQHQRAPRTTCWHGAAVCAWPTSATPRHLSCCCSHAACLCCAETRPCFISSWRARPEGLRGSLAPAGSGPNIVPRALHAIQDVSTLGNDAVPHSKGVGCSQPQSNPPPRLLACRLLPLLRWSRVRQRLPRRRGAASGPSRRRRRPRGRQRGPCGGPSRGPGSSSWRRTGCGGCWGPRGSRRLRCRWCLGLWTPRLKCCGCCWRVVLHFCNVGYEGAGRHILPCTVRGVGQHSHHVQKHMWRDSQEQSRSSPSAPNTPGCRFNWLVRVTAGQAPTHHFSMSHTTCACA
jgi:hypothetical protein